MITARQLATCAAKSPANATVTVRLVFQGGREYDNETLLPDAAEYSQLTENCELTVYLPKGWAPRCVAGVR